MVIEEAIRRGLEVKVTASEGDGSTHFGVAIEEGGRFKV
jgi:hypothetical protein